MDVQNLRENHPKLIAYMKESGYNTCYITRVKREIDRILSGASSKGWASYTDIYLEYVQESSSPSYLHEKLTYLGIIKNFDERAEYPDGRRRQKVVERGKYDLSKI
jgi:hypothetical protein